MECHLLPTDVCYGMLSEWWDEHDWPAVPKEALPPFCLLVSEEGPICAGFLYQTGTALNHFEWIVANPGARGKRLRSGIDFLIQEAKHLAKTSGAKMLFVSAKHKGLISRLEANGFGVTDLNMTNLIAGV